MDYVKGPKLNSKTLKPTSRDNLGITSAQTALQDRLCPVVNTVTYRAFYWPFLVWNYYVCINNKTKNEISDRSIGDVFNRNFVKKNDYYFILGTLLNMDADHQNLAGVDNGRAALNTDGPYIYNDKYLQAYFGGMFYYGGGCDTLGFITDHEQNGERVPGLARLTESIGKPIAEAFDGVINDTRYYKEYMLSDKPVPKDVLEELGRVMRIDMHGMDACKALMRKAFFDECDNEKFSNKYLIQSRDYLKFLYMKYDLVQKPDDKAFRRILFDWFSPRGQYRYSYPDYIEYVVKEWESIVGRQYFTTAIEIICNTMIRCLDVPKSLEKLLDDLIRNSDWRDINIGDHIGQYIGNASLDYDEREELIYKGRREERNGCNNALKVLFSVYDRFVDRDDISEGAMNCGDPISIKNFIKKMDEMRDEPVRSFLAYIMKNWIIDQNEAVAFEKLMQGRNGYLFEQVDNCYRSTGAKTAAAFQGIRLVNLYQVMKDLDCFVKE